MAPLFFPKTQLSSVLAWFTTGPSQSHKREEPGKMSGRASSLVCPYTAGIPCCSVGQDGKRALSKSPGIGLEFTATLSTPNAHQSIQGNRVLSVPEREGHGEGRDGPCSRRDFREAVRELSKCLPEGIRKQGGPSAIGVWDLPSTETEDRRDEMVSQREASSPSGPSLLSSCALPLHIPRHVPGACRCRTKRQTHPLLTLALTQPASLEES